MALAPFCQASAQTTGPADSIRVGNMIIVNKGGKTAATETSRPDTVPGQPGDTLRVGNIIIRTSGGKDHDHNVLDRIRDRRRRSGERASNISTNWLILDLGFSNYINKTSDYSPAGTGGYLYNRPGAAPLGESDFELRTGKSINVNIWFFMQRLNLIKHHVNLKYGLGLELNNYRYRSQLSYLKENPFVSGVAPAPVIIRDSVFFSKNKLAADYLTIPVMLNFCTNPDNQDRGFSLSFGISAGFLYSQRNKQISDERGKVKAKDGLGLEQFKLSYIGEIGMGPVKLYGSYSPNSFFRRGLDMRPYTLGIRLSSW
jgi:hypothetical protein